MVVKKEPENLNSALSAVIPRLEIKEANLSSGIWHLYYYEDHRNILNSAEAIEKLEELTQHCGRKKLLDSILVRAYPMLVFLDPGQKVLRFAHFRLFREKNLLEICDDSTPGLEELKDHLSYFDFDSFKQQYSVLENITRKYPLVDFFSEELDFSKVDGLAEQYVLKTQKQIKEISKSPLEKVSDFSLNLMTKYSSLRNHLLRFIAAMPSLNYEGADTQVKKLLIEVLDDIGQEEKIDASISAWGRFLVWSLREGISFLPSFIVSFVARSSIKTMAKRFIAGEDLTSAKKALISLKKTGRASSLDPLGELVVSKLEADEYCEKVVSFIEGYHDIIDLGELNQAQIPFAHISIKLSALSHHFCSYDFDYTYSQVAPRLSKILQAAHNRQVFINIDAEHFELRDIVLKIFLKLWEEQIKEWPNLQAGFVLQAYLRDAFEHLKIAHDWCLRHQKRLPVRLVKGAYWDQETTEARAHNYDAPQFLNKLETDLHYKQLVYYLLEHSNSFQLTIASHNIYDHCWAIALREEKFAQAPVLEHQCLHMTYESLSMVLAKQGHSVRNYIPIGNLLVGMAYLVRRIMENASQVGVLKHMRSEGSLDEIIGLTQKLKDKQKKGEWCFDESLSEQGVEYFNIPPIRPFLNSYKGAMLEAIHKQKELVYQKPNFDSPYQVQEKWNLLSRVQEWEKNKALRISTLLKAADLLWQRRAELSAIIMKESYKALQEACADVDEAIDFIHYYSVLEKGFDQNPRGGKYIVIAPWNFPLAILCGMSCAALLRGERLLIKPSEKTPYIGQIFFNLLLEAGVPRETMNLAQGEGKENLKEIIHSSDLSGILFTGSKKVGVKLFQDLSFSSHGMKNICTEMGGKNTIIISRNADLDQALLGTLYSCYAHGGQKCSACSVILIEEPIYEDFKRRFVQASRDLVVENAWNFSTQLNPLISVEDSERIKKIAKNLPGVLLNRSLEFDGNSSAPIIFEITHQEFTGQKIYQEEYFGPIVCLVKVRDFEEAIEVANSTSYALTAGLFSQSTKEQKKYIRSMDAGNIYINRSCTGARVGIEPFGGFKMSGTGPKAGGEEYLNFFCRSSIERPLYLKWEPMKVQADRDWSSLSFHSLTPEEKFQVKEYLDQLDGEIEDHYLTRNCPGQLNYIDTDLKVRHFVCLVKDHRFIDELKQICLHALFSGAKLIFILESFERSQIYKFAQTLLKLIPGWGSSILFLEEVEQAQGFINSSQTEVIYVDQDVCDKLIFSSKDHIIGDRGLKKIIDLSQFKQTKGFSYYPRLIAINTMRHGAPLESGLFQKEIM